MNGELGLGRMEEMKTSVSLERVRRRAMSIHQKELAKPRNWVRNGPQKDMTEGRTEKR